MGKRNAVASNQPALDDRESSLVGLSLQVEAKLRQPRARGRLKPPATPPSANSDQSRKLRYSADPTDYDIHPVIVSASPSLRAAKPSSAAVQPGKRSRFVPLALCGALAIAASAYVVQSRPDVLDATKSAWVQIESSARQRLETMTSAASPTPAVAVQASSELLAATPEPAVSGTPVADTGAKAEPRRTKIGDSSQPARRSRRRSRVRNRKVKPAW